MDFRTIDFETATADRNSPCEIGLTFVEGGRIVSTRSWLIKPLCYPYFNYWNIAIHGIKPEDVRDKPEFHHLWKEILPLIENKFLIAHNASFDFSVLRKTLEAYRLPFPSINYACSVIFSKKVWEGLPAYDLKTLCRFNNIEFNHHRAAADSRATAELTLKAFDKVGIPSLETFTEKFRTTVGQIFDGGYTPSKARKISKPKNSTTIL
jgi:DNA polymerase III subunit epsilon